MGSVFLRWVLAIHKTSVNIIKSLLVPLLPKAVIMYIYINRTADYPIIDQLDSISCKFCSFKK
nr:hypothetical protein [Mucilaginibacter sp. FT3.2]